MNWFITIKKSALGFFTGLAAVIVLGISQSITNYNPVICTAEIVENCTPGAMVTAYQAVIPAVSAFLVGAANWLKHRNK